ncbi:MAG: hypothetical protein ACI9B2_000752 [Flavobacteriales bacterium]
MPIKKKYIQNPLEQSRGFFCMFNKIIIHEI